MRFVSSFVVGVIAAVPAMSQEVALDCQAMLDGIVAEHPTDYLSCSAEVVPRPFRECQVPQTFTGTVPTSHMILAIDASGSMAGRVGGETKMEAAKREALNFLSDMPNEINIGLVVYGHKGNNQESGKAESCTASELVHDFDASRRNLEDSIRDLSPTGWTPLGGVLAYSAEVISTLEPPKEGDLAPVVYLISDGEETCNGDPVAAAAALYEAGVQTTVNTIGFDVDAETAAQLEAIAAAAGGTYYPANDVNALRSQLNAIKDSEAQMSRYQNCVASNSAQIAYSYRNAGSEFMGCWHKNDPTDLQSALLNAANKAVREDTAAAICSDMLKDYALNMDIDYGFMPDQMQAWNTEALREIEIYQEEMRLDRQ